MHIMTYILIKVTLLLGFSHSWGKALEDFLPPLPSSLISLELSLSCESSSLSWTCPLVWKSGRHSLNWLHGLWIAMRRSCLLTTAKPAKALVFSATARNWLFGLWSIDNRRKSLRNLLNKIEKNKAALDGVASSVHSHRKEW